MTKKVSDIQRLFLSSATILGMVGLSIIPPKPVIAQVKDTPQADKVPPTTDKITPAPTEKVPSSTDESPIPNKTTPDTNNQVSPPTTEVEAPTVPDPLPSDGSNSSPYPSTE